MKTENIDLIYSSVQSNLWQYARYSISNGEGSYFLNIVECLSIAKQLLISEPDNWLDFKKEFNEIFILLQKLDATIVCNEINIEKYNADSLKDIKKHLINDVLTTKFQSQISKLKRLQRENDEDLPGIKELINDIILLVDASLEDKKKVEPLLVDIIAKFHRSFPYIPLSTIKNDIGNLRTGDVTKVIDTLYSYLNIHNSQSLTSISSGFSQGDEILNIISRDLVIQLPDYSLEKRIEFSMVLRDVVNYFVNALRGGKSRFEFLFRPNSLESELQSSMLTFLQATERAEKYVSEIKEFADGGRVDIVYSSSISQIPIELKRTFENVTWESILENYIAQAQIYSYPHDQLSIFMVMDLSPQKNNVPEANLRNLFKIFNLRPRQNISINYPDYVVAFILPGNKILPSERSKYK